MSRKPVVLVVDDEATVREVLRTYLERDEFHVVEAATGHDAVDILYEQTPDLVILDIMIPGMDGLEITQMLRSTKGKQYLSLEKNIPVILLTARREEIDRITGFQLGADDYVVKPFSPRELMMRVKAVLRRSLPEETSEDEELSFADLTISPTRHEVTLQENLIPLTPKEYDLLLFFAKNPNKVFSRAQLVEKIWGYDFDGDDRIVTVHVCRLREKIEHDPDEPTYIQTVWGVGYKFDA